MKEFINHKHKPYEIDDIKIKADIEKRWKDME
jgi:hypothetical protein